MPYLVKHRLHERQLPLDYLPVIRELDRFVTAMHTALGPAKNDPAELFARHERLTTLARHHLPASDAISPSDAVRAFVLALLRATYFSDTVLSERPILDTLQTKTLGAFRTDFTPTDRARVRRALIDAFNLSKETLEDIDQSIERERDHLEIKRQLIEAIADRCPVDAEDDPNTSVWAMFGRFYPGHPLKMKEVSCIRTATNLFFCVPFSGSGPDARLTTRDVHDDALLTFLKRITQPPQVAHFPVFGCFRGNEIEPELLTQLAQDIGQTEDETASLLTTMVTILPSGDIEKYVVHDAYGHAWQAILFRFDERYQQLAQLGEPPLDPEGRLFDIIEAWVTRDPETPPDLSAFDTYLRQVMSERLHIAFNGLMAEVLADAIEFKLLVEDTKEGRALDSSSAFKHHPTKLDLTLFEVPVYFRFATQIFGKLLDDTTVQDAWKRAFHIARPGHDPARVDEAMRIVIERTAAWFDDVYAEKLQYDPTDDGIFVNAFTRVALNFLGFQTHFDDLYRRLLARRGPVRFADALIFVVATFLEESWEQNFWHLDECLTHFESLWSKFEASYADTSD